MSTSDQTTGQTCPTPTVFQRLASVRAVAYAARAFRFVGHVIRLRSIPLALWVDQYEAFQPAHKANHDSN